MSVLQQRLLLIALRTDNMLEIKAVGSWLLFLKQKIISLEIQTTQKISAVIFFKIMYFSKERLFKKTKIILIKCQAVCNQIGLVSTGSHQSREELYRSLTQVSTIFP